MRTRIKPAKHLVVLAIIVAICSLIAACGSSGKTKVSSSGGSATRASSTATKLSGKPIVIGAIADLTGYAGGPASGSLQKVWQEWVNATGGINGHPVKIELLDSETNPTVALQDVKKLIEQDHVMAIAGSNDNEDTSVAPYVTKSGVPWIGGQAFAPPSYTDPDWFPTGSDLSADEWGIGHVAASKGQKKWGLLYCAEAAICGQLATGYGSLVEKVFGATLVYSGKFSSTAPSYTPQCVALKEAGATAVYVVGAASVVSTVYTDCQQQGLTAAEYNTGGAVDSQVLANPAAKGLIDSTSDLPISDMTTPAGKALHAAIAKYDPGIVKDSTYGDGLMPEWAGLQMFRYAAGVGKLTPNSTPEQVKAALWKVKGQTLGGLTPPITYTKNKPTHVGCVFLEQLKGTQLVGLFGAKPQCEPASVAAIGAKIFG